MPYDDLVKRLRECTAEQNGEKTLWHQAADAIEDLDNRLNLHRQRKIRQWIPVTERLPEEEGSVLIFSKLGGIAEGHYSHTYGVWVQYRWNIKDIKVTHWMPLPPSPEPPKEET